MLTTRYQIEELTVTAVGTLGSNLQALSYYDIRNKH